MTKYGIQSGAADLTKGYLTIGNLTIGYLTIGNLTIVEI